MSEPLKGSRLIGYNSQSCVLFSPLALPYKGELDDYGQIESFNEDENTKLIEEYMGMPIAAFTKACIWGEEITVNKEKQFAAGCFIHSDVYDRFSKPIMGGKYAASLWTATFAGTRHLEAIGCKFSHEVEGRYKFVYKHPSILGVSFHTDGEFTHVFDDANGKQLHGYGLNDIQIALRTAGFSIFPKEDVRNAKSISEFQSAYKTEAQGLIESEKLIYFGLRNLRFLNNGMSEDLLIKYIEGFAQGRLLDRVEQLTYLLDSFSNANRILMPTIAGSQYPEHEVTSVITGCIDKIAKKRLTERRRYLIEG